MEAACRVRTIGPSNGYKSSVWILNQKFSLTKKVVSLSLRSQTLRKCPNTSNRKQSRASGVEGVARHRAAGAHRHVVGTSRIWLKRARTRATVAQRLPPQTHRTPGMIAPLSTMTTRVVSWRMPPSIACSTSLSLKYALLKGRPSLYMSPL